ncbi:MAG TPA: glycosyltransferase family 4 protein [Candidatus Saccharimonadales bacterium]|nr:glycosyltransferase family 4 protein [Candidatus Saccharimonadales bacterium]
MRIGLVCPYNIAKGGGVKEHIFACQAELRKRGHDVYILTPRPQDYEDAEPGKHIIFIGESKDFNSPLHTTVQVSASVNDTIDKVLAEHQFDILHFHEPWVPMLSAQILSRSKAVNVATFHAKLPETIMTRTMIKVVTPYTKSVLKYIDEFTAVSEAAAEYVCSLTDKPVALIPNGIDLAKYKMPLRRSDNRKQKTIFYLGRLEQRKGVKHLIHAFKLLRDHDSNVSLVIAGDGPDRAKLEALAADLGVDEHIAFIGFISEKEKIHYLRTADLYCSPALYGESFGIVLLEAMATGTVTVGGDNPGYASVLKGLGALSLVNPKHHAEFSRRLDLLLHENDLRRIWRDWAASQLPQYAYTTIVDQYEEVYEEALERHAGKKAPQDE